MSREYHEKPSHRFSGSVPAASVSDGSHAMRTYATEPSSAEGVRTVASPSGQPRVDTEAVREAQMRMQMQLDEIMRQLNPRQP
ncbi:hypothetical protein PG999_010648 [Apiospora kogelbergensis]|uniref:Uncharacterized protein n=1 Tax=Apiospora kogelbergensis TaxID=1337665 RepID=A0AAW0QKK9_9PEZI